MREVSCRATRIILFGAPIFGVPVEDLAKDVPYTLEHLRTPRNRVDWDHFVTMMERLLEGKSDQEVIDRCVQYYAETTSMASFLGALSGYFTNARVFFRFVTCSAVPSMYTNLKVRYEVLDKNHVRITLEIPPPYRDSRAFLIGSTGCIASCGRFLGLPSAIVDPHIEPRRGVYTVRLPPSATIWARLRRAFRALFAARAALEEFHSQYLEMAREHSQMTDMHLGFQEIIERMPTGVIVLRDGKIVYANRVIVRAFGVASARELEGRGLRDCVVEEDLGELEHAIRHVSADELPPEVHFKGQAHRLVMQIHFVKGIHFGGQVCDFLITHDVTENRRLEQDIIDAGSREQRRLAQEMHDNLVQRMASVGYKGDVLVERLRDAGSSHAETLAGIIAMNRVAMKEARTIARHADPVQLNRDGLPSALLDLAATAGETYDIDCTFRQDISLGSFDRDVALHLYRIAQEALSNAVRHGNPQCVRLELCTRDGLLALTVADDGEGIPRDAPRSEGMGLRNMQHRARVIGASFAVSPNSPQGTVVSCTLPVEHASSGSGSCR